MRIFLLLLALFVLAVPPAEAEHLTYPPFDDAAKDPSFKAYRDRLQAAVEQRNVDAVVAMAAPNVMLSFGGESGRAEFKSYLTGDDAAFFWETLGRILKEGGSFQNGEFVAPWTFLYEPPESLDIYSVAIVAGKNVRLRKSPSTEAPVIRALSYEVVEMPPYDANRQDTVTDATGREWKLMRTTHGEEGWIASSYLRFLLDHRAGFAKTPQGWQMTFFVAGD